MQVLLLARASGLLRLGTVSIDGTKIDANASKIRSVPYDRAKGRTQPHRPYDFRPPPKPNARRITEPWRIAMKAKLETEDGKRRYRQRKQTEEPVFGIIKSAMGFLRFHRRSIQNVAAEWLLIAFAYNCRRIARLQEA